MPIPEKLTEGKMEYREIEIHHNDIHAFKVGKTIWAGKNIAGDDGINCQTAIQISKNSVSISFDTDEAEDMVAVVKQLLQPEAP